MNFGLGQTGGDVSRDVSEVFGPSRTLARTPDKSATATGSEMSESVDGGINRSGRGKKRKILTPTSGGAFDKLNSDPLEVLLKSSEELTNVLNRPANKITAGVANKLKALWCDITELAHVLLHKASAAEHTLALTKKNLEIEGLKNRLSGCGTDLNESATKGVVGGVQNVASPVTEQRTELSSSMAGQATYASISSAPVKPILISQSSAKNLANVAAQPEFHVVSRKRPDAKSIANRASLVITSTTDIEQVESAIRDLGTEIHVHAIRKLGGDKIKIDAGTRHDLQKIKANLSGKGYSASEEQCMGPKFILFDAKKSWSNDFILREIFDRNFKSQAIAWSEFQGNVVVRDRRKESLDTTSIIVEVRGWGSCLAVFRRLSRVYVDVRSLRCQSYDDALRCFRCLRYGHRSGRCRQTEATCVHCGTVGHEVENCDKKSNDPRCINCADQGLQSNHRATWSRCPVMQGEIRVYRELLKNLEHEFSKGT